MTRSEWYSQYSSLRAANPEPPSTPPDRLGAVLKELYESDLLPFEEVYCYLVDRYRDKLTQKHFDKYLMYKKNGKERVRRYLSGIAHKNNPFMAFLSKSAKDDFCGKYVPLQVGYESEDSTNE